MIKKVKLFIVFIFVFTLIIYLLSGDSDVKAFNEKFVCLYQNEQGETVQITPVETTTLAENVKNKLENIKQIPGKLKNKIITPKKNLDFGVSVGYYPTIGGVSLGIDKDLVGFFGTKLNLGVGVLSYKNRIDNYYERQMMMSVGGFSLMNSLENRKFAPYFDISVRF